MYIVNWFNLASGILHLQQPFCLLLFASTLAVDSSVTIAYVGLIEFHGLSSQ